MVRPYTEISFPATLSLMAFDTTRLGLAMTRRLVQGNLPRGLRYVEKFRSDRSGAD